MCGIDLRWVRGDFRWPSKNCGQCPTCQTQYNKCCRRNFSDDLNIYVISRLDKPKYRAKLSESKGCLLVKWHHYRSYKSCDITGHTCHVTSLQVIHVIWDHYRSYMSCDIIGHTCHVTCCDITGQTCCDITGHVTWHQYRLWQIDLLWPFNVNKKYLSYTCHVTSVQVIHVMWH